MSSSQVPASERPTVPTRLLVHALIREDNTVDTAELYSVANLMGMSDQQVRLCLKRLIAEDLFTQEGRGRKAILQAATQTSASNVEHVRHAYRQDHGFAPWDGTWHMFAFAIPESRRTTRDALRNFLLHLGAAPIQGGLYISANPITESIERQADRLGVLANVTFLTNTDLRIGRTTAPRQLASAIWPLDEIAARHEKLARFGQTAAKHLARTGGLTYIERLTLAIELAAEFTAAMAPDPLLPPELLPQPWPGQQARHIVADCWATLRALPDQSDSRTSKLRLFRQYGDAFTSQGGP